MCGAGQSPLSPTGEKEPLPIYRRNLLKHFVNISLLHFQKKYFTNSPLCRAALIQSAMESLVPDLVTDLTQLPCNWQNRQKKHFVWQLCHFDVWPSEFFCDVKKYQPAKSAEVSKQWRLFVKAKKLRVCGLWTYWKPAKNAFCALVSKLWSLFVSQKSCGAKKSF